MKENDVVLDQREIVNSVWTSIWKYFGLKEASKVGLWLLDINNVEGFGIVRCSHQTKEIVMSSLTLITEISGNKVILSPIKTSGTIRSIKKIKELMLTKE
ncbi:MAG: Rpp14/Pop5 family protein [Candidatus Lokiarchaeota archaeon]|nr:Rpp14/Pop5 family protein [Candidatus Lokiarchaeota archaeon]